MAKGEGVPVGRPYVSVVCDRPAPDHPEGTPVRLVRSFVRGETSCVPRDQPGVWVRRPTWAEASVVGADGVRVEAIVDELEMLRPRRGATEPQDGSSLWVTRLEPVPTEALTAGEDDPTGRWVLRCDVCRNTVSARQERIFPVLERLHQAGVTRLSLDGLRRVI